MHRIDFSGIKVKCEPLLQMSTTKRQSHEYSLFISREVRAEHGSAWWPLSAWWPVDSTEPERKKSLRATSPLHHRIQQGKQVSTQRPLISLQCRRGKASPCLCSLSPEWQQRALFGEQQQNKESQAWHRGDKKRKEKPDPPPLFLRLQGKDKD